MKPILEIEHIGKKYLINQNSEPYLSLRDALQKPFTRRSKESFWALKDVSFKVEAGESIGIIGKNGAGKSTLLKILSRITPPSEGKIISRGRIASLLEVGTGFHAELTGRENVYMNGSILGMRRKEIDRNFDAIVDFSGVEKFIDTPLKHYSSGMQLRLAFAVAAFLENEVLIIDEVLAVGDAEFQKKCIGKMQDVSSSGRTVLFVSHNITAVKTLCTRGIVLRDGQVVFDGDQYEASQFYVDSGMQNDHLEHTGNIHEAPGNEFIRLSKAGLSPRNGSTISMFSGIDFNLRFYCGKPGIALDLTLEVSTIEGIVVFHSGLVLTEDTAAGFYNVTISLPDQLLNTGVYTLTLIFGENQRHLLHRFDEIIRFEVIHDTNGSNSQKLPGIVFPQLTVKSAYDGEIV